MAQGGNPPGQGQGGGHCGGREKACELTLLKPVVGKHQHKPAQNNRAGLKNFKNHNKIEL